MAAKPIDSIIAETIVAEWRTGEYSQQKLADKHKVSKGVVNKLCKGVSQDMTSIVTAGVQYQSGLAAQDDRIVTAVKEVVDIKSRIKARIDNFAEAAIDKAESLLQTTESGSDFKAITDGVDRISITTGVNQRHAQGTVINNNQQNNYAALNDSELQRELQIVRERNSVIN